MDASSSYFPFFTSPIRTTCFLSFFSNKFLESSSSINPHNIWVNRLTHLFSSFVLRFENIRTTLRAMVKTCQNRVTQDQFKDASEAMVAMSEHRRFVQANGQPFAMRKYGRFFSPFFQWEFQDTKMEVPPI